MSSLLVELAVEIQEIRDTEVLPSPPPSPRVPPMNNINIPERQRIYNIQKFIESFEYNYTGKPFLQMKKSRGASHIQLCAKQIIKAALPIQCVEAVFLGAYLTSTYTTVDRVPLSFKSKFKENVHRHIVLAIRQDGKWGALGLSRRQCLMNKQFKYDNLSQLVKDYENSYEECFHKLLTVYVGLPLPHEVFTDQPIKWRAIKVRIYSVDENEIVEKIDNFVMSMNKMNEHFKREGVLPDGLLKKKEGVYKSPRSLHRSHKSSGSSSSGNAFQSLNSSMNSNFSTDDSDSGIGEA